MGRQSWTRLIGALLCLAAAWLGTYSTAADTVRWTQNEAGDTQSITLHADEITTWSDGKQRRLLLKGMVLIQHGMLQVWARQATAWVTPKSNDGIVRVDVYVEGDVRMENGKTGQRVEKAVLDLYTRGELKLKAHKGKVAEKSLTDDPLYRRASEEHALAFPLPAGSGVERTSYQPPDAGTVTPIGPATMPPPSANGPGVLPDQRPPPSGQLLPPYPIPGSPGYPPGSSPVPVAPEPMPERPPGAVPPQPAKVVAPVRQIHIAPRTQGPFQEQTIQLPNGDQAFIITGGVIITVSNPTGSIQLLDIESDRAIVWTKNNLQQMYGNMRRPEGGNTREVEFYLAGNVELRERSGKDTRTLRADELYYDVNRNVAVAYQADLEMRQPGIPFPLHMKAEELLQVSPTLFEASRAEIFASKLPSDPGLKVYITHVNVEELKVPQKSIFGRQVVDRNTGQPVTEAQSIFTGNNVFFEVADVPVFYLPYIHGDARDPFGPLEMVNINYNRIFGMQIMTTWDPYDLIGIQRIPGTRWRVFLDEMNRRGPAAGSLFDYTGTGLIPDTGIYRGRFLTYGIHDTGADILGGGRGFLLVHPHWRGRIFDRHYQELTDDLTLQAQVSALSDKNFFEQYYFNEYNTDLNQETFAYLKYQHDNYAGSILAEQRIRTWVSETQWLPRGDGYLIGQSFFDPAGVGVPWFTYNVQAHAGYGQLKVAGFPPPVTTQPSGLTTARVDSGLFDLWQDISAPFYLGPVRMDPYGVVDLTQYTQDLTGASRGRFYGAGGVRASLPLTRLYPTIESDLLNVNGINHKLMFGLNFYDAYSDTPFTSLPQLFRLQDDATDQAIRDITPMQPFLNPQYGTFLATSPLYDTQTYAIRRLVDNRPDTLDSIEVLQMDLRQRWQTKRGYPGMQHIIDWMLLDVSASYFPQENRDNFGYPFAFLEYGWMWNVGDRTALVSNGWYDPIPNGIRQTTIGAFLNRTDRTNFFIGYRQTDPLQSRLVTGSASYVFSPKYAITASSSYDLGISQSLSNSLILTRMGSDVQISMGINYNSIINNFGFTFAILPVLGSSQSQGAMTSLTNPGGMMGQGR